MKISKDNVGIIGGGFVGQILKKWFPDAPVYDPHVGEYKKNFSDVFNADVIFIAFNLTDNAISPESLDEIRHYCDMDGSRLFIIKSTFIPGTTDLLQKEYPQHKFIYNPEFLTERTAWDDFRKPQFQILGATNEALHLVEDVFAILPNAPVLSVISPLDAEVMKHAKNSYYALKVTWFNQLYDACQGLGADYETIRQLLVQDPWVGDSHSIIFHKGYRGFGGKCLSKDPLAFTKVARLPLLEKAIEINNGYLRTE